MLHLPDKDFKYAAEIKVIKIMLVSNSFQFTKVVFFGCREEHFSILCYIWRKSLCRLKSSAFQLYCSHFLCVILAQVSATPFFPYSFNYNLLVVALWSKFDHNFKFKVWTVLRFYCQRLYLYIHIFFQGYSVN